MNITPSKVVHRQKALFSRNLPFKPQYGMMLYVEAGANEEINGYFHKNMEKAVNILGKSFTYLPAILDKLAQIVEYNWPETDSAWIERAKSDPSWIQDTYREILSYRIDKEDKMPELPLQIVELPMLMRYEETSLDGHVFTLFPLLYSDDAQFEQLLTAIAQVPRPDSNTFHSTLIEQPLRYSRLRENVDTDPRDNADRGRIDVLADEIRQRIEEMRSIGVSDFVIKKLIALPDPKLSTLRITKDYGIFLPDYNNMEISLPTLSKVVYFFFLRHPKGLRFKELIDYREELLQIYRLISNRYDAAKMKRMVLPSMQTVSPSASCAMEETQLIKQRLKDSLSTSWKNRSKVSCDGMPLDRSSRFSKNSLHPAVAEVRDVLPSPQPA